ISRPQASAPARLAKGRACTASAPDRGSQVRTRLPAGGRWIRTSGSAPAATPLTDRGVKPQATAAGCHFGEILTQGDLDDGTVGQLLEELAGEMDRPSDRKRRISGYGDRTWTRKADE